MSMRGEMAMAIGHLRLMYPRFSAVHCSYYCHRLTPIYWMHIPGKRMKFDTFSEMWTWIRRHEVLFRDFRSTPA